MSLGRLADGPNASWPTPVHPPDWQAPSPLPLYDLVVVGGGPAGLVSAVGAASLGARTALVEEGLLGGDCLNFGCVPSKALLAAARRRESFGEARKAVDRAREELAAADSAARLASLGIHVFFGRAGFSDRRRIEVGDTALRFRRAVIATGTRPALPAIDGLAEAGPLTNETVFELDALPARLAVIGGGPVGCELAQAFAGLGSQVTVVETEDSILPAEDRDAAAIVRASLAGDGVDFRTSAKVVAVRPAGQAHSLKLSSEETIEADRILVAAGRTAKLDGMGLDSAGVAWGTRGITVNDRLATTNPRIFACGDVTSGHSKLTQAADAEARLVLRNALFRGRARRGRIIIPWCTYTHPELAHVGISSAEAETMPSVRTITVNAAETDRFVVEQDLAGFLRVHVSGPRGRVLGATVVGSHAGELIATVTVAMKAGLGLAGLAETVLPYPTRSEMLRRAADAWRRTRLTPMAARVLRSLIRLPG